MSLVPRFWREKIRIFSCLFIPPLLVIKPTFYFDPQFIHQFLVCRDVEVGRNVIVEAFSTYIFTLFYPQVVTIFHKPTLFIDELMVYEI